MTKEELKADEIAFIDEYLICMNGVQAYLIVHPKSSYGAARTNASRLLSKVTVKAEIEKRMTEHAMSANEVIKRISEIARGSLYPFLKIEGKKAYVDLNNPEAQKYLYLLKEIKQVERETDKSSENWVEIKTYDALKALETLARIHKLLTDKLEVNEKKVIRVTIGKSDG